MCKQDIREGLPSGGVGHSCSPMYGPVKGTQEALERQNKAEDPQAVRGRSPQATQPQVYPDRVRGGGGGGGGGGDIGHKLGVSCILVLAITKCLGVEVS